MDSGNFTRKMSLSAFMKTYSSQSFGIYTVSQSRSVVTSTENPAPDNSPRSIGELRYGHVANLQEHYYIRLFRKMAWYKILIQVLIV